jgi:hypothetical protein
VRLIEARKITDPLREARRIVAERDVDIRELERAYNAVAGDKWTPEEAAYRFALNRSGKKMPLDMWYQEVAGIAIKRLNDGAKNLETAANVVASYYRIPEDQEVFSKRALTMAAAARSAAARLARSKMFPRLSMRTYRSTTSVTRPGTLDWQGKLREASDNVSQSASCLRDIAFDMEAPHIGLSPDAVFAAVRWLMNLTNAISALRDPYGGHYRNDEWKKPIPA